jgi:hypothetical protein
MRMMPIVQMMPTLAMKPIISSTIPKTIMFHPLDVSRAAEP